MAKSGTVAYSPWGVSVPVPPWMCWEKSSERTPISVTPRYLELHRHHRDEATAAQTYKCHLLSQGKAVVKETRSDMARVRLQKMWIVQKPDLNAWRKASLDAWSIYNLREETLIKDDPKEKTPTSTPRLDHQPTLDLIKDFQLVKERTCILEAPTKNPDKLAQKRFSKVILQKYHTPTKHAIYSYCTPQDAITASLVPEPTLTELIQKSKDPPEIPVNPRKQNPVSSVHVSPTQHQFCDTLGPSSCQRCIEETNRKIAKEIEQSSFPILECSATTLVAPTLARMMTKSRFVPSSSRGRQVSRGSDVLLPPVGKDVNPDRKSAASLHERASAVRQDKLVRYGSAVTQNKLIVHGPDSATVQESTLRPTDHGPGSAEPEDKLLAHGSDSSEPQNKLIVHGLDSAAQEDTPIVHEPDSTQAQDTFPYPVNEPDCRIRQT